MGQLKNPKPNYGDGLAKQSFKDACDINKIVKRFVDSGVVDARLLNDGGVFADVSAVGDFRSVVQTVRMAQEQFESLPDAIRDRFGSADLLLSFLDDPKNRAEAVKLGLVKEAPVVVKKEPVEVRVVGDEQAKPAV